MESQNLSNQPTESPTVTDSSDRSKFLKSLGFDRVKEEQSEALPLTDRLGEPKSNEIENISAPVREAMVLSSNFEDDLELPGVTNLKEPVRKAPAGPFADFGNPKLEEEPEVSKETTEPPLNLREELENESIDSRYEEEVSFDVAAIDDSTWAAVDHRMRPEPIDTSTSPPRRDRKKKNVPEVPVSPPAEANRSPMPPPLECDIEPEAPTEEVEQTCEAEISPEEGTVYSEEQQESAGETAPLKGPLNLNCPACDRGLTLQPEHLGIPGNCVWCDTSIIAAESGLDHSVSIFCIAVDLPVHPDSLETEEVSAVDTSADTPPARSEEVQTKKGNVDQSENVPTLEQPTIPSGEVESSPWTEPTHIPNQSVDGSPQPVSPTGGDSPALNEPALDVELQSQQEPSTAAAEVVADVPVDASPFSDLIEIETGKETESKKESNDGAGIDTEMVEKTEGLPAIEPENTSLPEGDIMVDPTAEASIPLARLDSLRQSVGKRDVGVDSSFSELPAPMPNVDVFPNAEAEVNAEEFTLPQSPFEDLAHSPAEGEDTFESNSESQSPFGESATKPIEEESAAPVSPAPFDNPTQNELTGVDIPPPQNTGPSSMLSSIAHPSPFDPPSQSVLDGLPGVPTAAPQGQPVAGTTSSLTPLPWDEVRGSGSENKRGLRENVGIVQSAGMPKADEPITPVQSQVIAEPSRKPSTTKRSKTGRSKTAVVIAVLGLVSGAGIASFFLPVDGYIKNLKESWVEWFEQKASADDEWTENVIIPQKPKPANDDSEPDPFTTHKAPGSE